MSKRRAVLIAAALSLLYFAIQLAYVSRLPLVMDEFDGAHEAYQLLQRTPYQDFRPYKTVLGYYLGVPPLLLTTDPWTGLMFSKIWLAAINSAAIFMATLSLATIFSPSAALTGQLLLVFVTTFLERSSEIRVDMLTAWAGLASFLLLLRRRWLAAGIVAGLSFLVSQKGVYYILSANAAAGVFWLVESRDRRTFRDLLLLNLGAVSAIAAYLGLWGLVSSPSTVFNATFLSHGDIMFREFYDLEIHWRRTLTRNPLYYGGALAGIVALTVAWWRGHASGTHLMVAAYTALLFALCRWHRQPWPYFFVILIPTLMVTQAAVAELVLRNRRWLPIAAGVVLVLGVAYPLTHMPAILAQDLSYQRHVIRLADALLDEGDTYLAGNDLIYDRTQAVLALRRLSATRVQAMRQWPQSRIDELIADLEEARPKLIIRDYRLAGLPHPVSAYLDSRFQPLWSSVRIYSPLVAVEEQAFEIWFSGEYLVEAAGGTAIIDGQRISAGTTVTLQRGRHTNGSSSPVRLRLQPAALAAHADPQMQRRRPMFGRVYDY